MTTVQRNALELGVLFSGVEWVASHHNPQEQPFNSATPRTLTPAPPSVFSRTPKQSRTTMVAGSAKQTPRPDDLTQRQVRRSSEFHPAGEPDVDALKLRRLEEVQSMYAIPVYKRALSLTMDAIVLTLASPFFAVWWVARTIKRLTSPK